MATAVITGSARGIGAAIAFRLAKDGFDIALNDISEKSFENNDITERIKALGVKCEKYIADVSDGKQVESMVKAIKDDFGSVDVLVNNAGITRDGLLAKMSEEDFDRVIDTNLKGAFNTIRHMTRWFLKQRSGKIINLSSVSGIMGNPGQANYSASKAGVIGLTKSAARELASRGICVNAIAPGFIDTDMTASLPGAAREKLQENIPMKRIGEPKDIANMAVFLASGKSDYITGQVLAVDGGMTI